MKRVLIVLWCASAGWACGGGPEARVSISPSTTLDGGAPGPDAGLGAGPHCGDDVELSGARRQDPPARWRTWDREALTCLDEAGIAAHGSFDDLAFWRAEAIETEDGQERGALVCAKNAIVVHKNAWTGETPRAALIAAHVDKADRARASAACDAAGPRCGADLDPGSLQAIEAPSQARAWYEEITACLEGLGIEPRYAFEAFSWWSGSVEYGAVCSDGALLLPRAAASERAVRLVMAIANADPDDQEKVTEACVDAP